MMLCENGLIETYRSGVKARRLQSGYHGTVQVSRHPRAEPFRDVEDTHRDDDIPTITCPLFGPTGGSCVALARVR